MPPLSISSIQIASTNGSITVDPASGDTTLPGATVTVGIDKPTSIIILGKVEVNNNAPGLEVFGAGLYVDGSELAGRSDHTFPKGGAEIFSVHGAAMLPVGLHTVELRGRVGTQVNFVQGQLIVIVF